MVFKVVKPNAGANAASHAGSNSGTMERKEGIVSEHALWVDFEIKPEHVETFRVAVLRNARASVADEPGCLRFDVLDALPRAPRFFLYEIYVDEAAFQAHLATPHFKIFDTASAPWIARKAVQFASVTQIAKPA